MVKKEDLLGKTQQEIQELLENDVKRFSVELEELATEEEVLDKEQEIMQAMTDNDTYLKSVHYKLPEDCDYDNRKYNKQTVCEYIAEFIGLQEVEWSYSLGMFELVKIWKDKNLEHIQYHAYDSTLRILGQAKYKGFESWRKILTVNEFLTGCHDEYVRDTAYMIYLANLHNVVIDALKRFNPEVEEEVEAK